MGKGRAFFLFLFFFFLSLSCSEPGRRENLFRGGGRAPWPGVWRLAPGVDFRVVPRKGGEGFQAFLSKKGPWDLERSPGGGWWVPALGMQVVFSGTKARGRVLLSRFGERVWGVGARKGKDLSPGRALTPLERVKRWIPAWMDLYNVPGVSFALIRDRRPGERVQFGVLASNAPWKVKEDSLFEACSMSKPLFSYALLKLVEEGKLDLDRSLDSYLPSPYLPGLEWSGLVTARMVLTHRTGLPNWRKGGWRGGGPLHFLARPGTRFTYSGEGFTWLQAVVERITRTPLDAWMERKVLRPMGMALSSYRWRKAFEPLYAHGHDKLGRLKNHAHYYRPNAAFSLYTSPAEYARFLSALLVPGSKEAWRLKPETRDLMLRGVSPGGEGTLRSLGFAVRPFPGGALVEHGGSNGAGFRCFSFIDPARGSGLVIMTNSDSGRALYLRVLEVLEPRYRGLARAELGG